MQKVYLSGGREPKHRLKFCTKNLYAEEKLRQFITRFSYRVSCLNSVTSEGRGAEIPSPPTLSTYSFLLNANFVERFVFSDIRFVFP